MSQKKGFSVPIVIFFVFVIVAMAGAFRFQNSIRKQIGIFSEGHGVTTEKKNEAQPVDATESALQNTPQVSSAKEDDPTLIKSSFTDLFSGTGWIVTEKTTLVHDMSATGFSFAPDIMWEKTNETVSGVIPSSSLCIKNECLVVRDHNIFLNGVAIHLPEEISKTGRTLSVGVIGDRFLVFGVVPEGSIYKTYGYFFQDKNFSSLCGSDYVFSSSYRGDVGAGGAPENFLVVYGGYEGKGIQVLGGVCNDISGYLGIRVMSGGFSPKIIKTQNSWYLWSATPGVPRLLKLITDTTTQKISGTFDFAPLLFPSGIQSVFFSEEGTSKEPIQLRGLVVLPNNSLEVWRFIDRGFHFQETATIVSKNINTNPTMKVREARIVSALLSPGDTNAEFYLSNDGDEWARVAVGTPISFLNRSGNVLFWKVVFRAHDPRKIPPFLGQINIEYKAKPF